MHVYRICQNNPPIEEDMKSQEALGAKPRRPLTDEDRVHWAEVSTFDTARRGMEMAQLLPRLGGFIARMEIAEDLINSYDEETGHVGLHGVAPDQLLGAVRSVWAVHEVPLDDEI
ncbi:MAG: hypothetical protein WB808_09205 [Candidatus Dormiibacterota bacterium]